MEAKNEKPKCIIIGGGAIGSTILHHMHNSETNQVIVLPIEKVAEVDIKPPSIVELFPTGPFKCGKEKRRERRKLQRKHKK